MSSLGKELIEKDVESTPIQELQEVASDSSFKNNLDRLTIETLRLLCFVEGLPEIENKKDLAEHFATKLLNNIKGKETTNVDDSWQGDKEYYYGTYNQARSIYDVSENILWNHTEGTYIEDRRYISLKKSLEKSLQAILAKALEEIKISLRLSEKQENKDWSEVKINRPRNQFEYEEWRKVGKLLDEALMSKSWNQDVAAALKESCNESPLETMFKEKLMVARQYKNKKRKLDYSLTTTVILLFPTFVILAMVTLYNQPSQRVPLEQINTNAPEFNYAPPTYQQMNDLEAQLTTLGDTKERRDIGYSRGTKSNQEDS
ncbi:10790_t:CDS:2 [Racocetra fulgida]|uniref:10790_t:CDS:1 n=1 Tax=Racocetra fulgida TaxID=60492 RepID=A0A9N9FYF9_9GLOM|nr:10790_t:CDS:2 [Racocetra fulgida]